VLFKSKHVGAKAVRAVSGQPYDHIGLMIKRKGSAYFVEAIANIGVAFHQLSPSLLREWRRTYSKVVYRKLECERSEEFEDTVLICYVAWVGRPYALTLNKLRRKYSSALDYHNFFCSQLVAAFYKKLHLLPRGVSSCAYWPSAFAFERGLTLVRGGLSEEMEVS
jgi:hypothetical protein